MTLNDLGTVMEHRLPIKIALMNDGRQQMVIPGPWLRPRRSAVLSHSFPDTGWVEAFMRLGIGSSWVRVDHELL